jgi:hypothetical protein
VNKAFNDAGKGLYDLFFPFDFKLKKELEKACLEGNTEKTTEIVQSAGLLNKLGLVHIGQINNIQQVLYKAQPLIQNPENEQIDPKKRDKILEAIKFEYDEQAQDLWAKLIAGEINNPSSYSIRTIEVLKNLSMEEAQLFQNIAPYISIFCGIVSILSPIFWKPNAISSPLNFESQLKLVNAGLFVSNSLNGDGGTAISTDFTDTTYSMKTIGETFDILEFPKRRALLCASRKMDINTPFSIPCILLTQEGKEILQLIDSSSENELNYEYLKNLSLHFKSYFDLLNIIVYKNATKQLDGNYRYEELEKIELE